MPAIRCTLKYCGWQYCVLSGSLTKGLTCGKGRFNACLQMSIFVQVIRMCCGISKYNNLNAAIISKYKLQTYLYVCDRAQYSSVRGNCGIWKNLLFLWPFLLAVFILSPWKGLKIGGEIAIPCIYTRVPCQQAWRKMICP